MYYIENDVLDDILQDTSSREECFEQISTSASSETRLIAHFLLDFNKIQKIFIDNSTRVQERLYNILTTWYEENGDANQATWIYLKSLLLFLNKRSLVRQLENNESKLFLYTSTDLKSEK